MKFGTIDRRILFPLADHISFAADRILSGEQISNPLTEDIRVLFHSEYEVASQLIIPPSVFLRAGYVEHAAEMKKAVQIPVIAVGRINDVEIAESVLQSKKADRSEG